MGFSPFHLAFGIEAVLPIEVMLPISRTIAVENGTTDQLLDLDRSQAEEPRQAAVEHITKYQKDIKRCYDQKVRPRVFRPRDWLLRKVVRPHEQGKLDVNW